MALKRSSLRETVRTVYKDATLKKLYPGRYKAACKAPVEPGYVVFLEIREKALSDNFKLIRAALERENQKLDEASGASGPVAGADLLDNDAELPDAGADLAAGEQGGAQDSAMGDAQGSAMGSALDSTAGSAQSNAMGGSAQGGVLDGIQGNVANSAQGGRPRRQRKKIHWTMSVICIREGMENQAVVIRNCLSAIPHLAKAQFIFVNESSYFLSSLPIRKETTVIQTWHACGAFKKFGYSVLGKGFGTTKEDLEKYPVHGNFSYVTVSAPEVEWAYAEAFHMEDHPEKILPIGVSRTDMFFSRKYREKACGKTSWVLRRMAPHLFAGHGDVYSDRVKSEGEEDLLKVVPGKKIILYAPTFRGQVANASSPDRLDIPLLKKRFGHEYILLINHHPFVKEKDRPKVPMSCRDFAFDMTDQLSIEELLTAADVCITDYSSLIFEYSLFERPVIFYAFDMKEYLDERGFYYPISEMMPGPVCSKTQEVADALNDPETFDLARIRDFKYRFMGACDGHATYRILKLMERC